MSLRNLLNFGFAALALVTVAGASAAAQGDAFPAPPKNPEPITPPQALDQASEEGQAVAQADRESSAELDTADLPVLTPRYAGTWQEGYDALLQASEEGELDEAIAVADALLQPSIFQVWRETTLAGGTPWQRRLAKAVSPVFDRFGWMQPGDRERAELRFARGTLQTVQARRLLEEGGEGAGEAALLATETAREDFSVSRALAGPGELRRDATYSQSRVMAERAEEARLGIPEIREKLGLPALPPPAPPAPGPAGPQGAGEQPDPDADLKAVRGLYLDAREPLLERIMLGEFEDRDVQANLELIQRRLRELASIERQREEEEQQQEQGDQEQNQDPSESEDENEEGEPNQDSSDSEGQDSEPKDGEQSENPPEDPEASEEEQQTPEELEDPQPGEIPEDLPAEEAERLLTREEVMRLLERLKQIEEEGESVRRQARRGQQKPVKRDW